MIDSFYLAETDEGHAEDVPAPAIARQFWKLPADATLQDVVLAVRADEVHHRDLNHGFDSKIAGERIVERVPAPYPEHAAGIRLAG